MSQADFRLSKIVGTKIHGNYSTARGIASLFGLFGWTLFCAGILGAVFGFVSGLIPPFNIVVMALGILIAAIGLLQVAAQQMLRSMVDTADYARQALLIQVGLAEGRNEIDLRKPPTR